MCIILRSRARLHALGLRRGKGSIRRLSPQPTVPESVQGPVHTIARLHTRKAEPVASTRVAQIARIEPLVASCRVHSVIDQGYLHDLKDTLRKPSYLAPTAPLPEELEILPPRCPSGCIQSVQACRRNGGDTHPPPPNATGGKEEEGGRAGIPSENGARLHAGEDASKEAAHEGRARGSRCDWRSRSHPA